MNARDYAKVYLTYWTGTTGQCITTPDAKLVGLYLFTGPHVMLTHSGVWRIDDDTVEEHTTIKPDAYRVALGVLEGAGLIELDARRKWVWVREFAMFQLCGQGRPNAPSPDIKKCWTEYVALSRQCPDLAERWYERYESDLFLRDSPSVEAVRLGKRTAEIPRGKSADSKKPIDTQSESRRTQSTPNQNQDAPNQNQGEVNQNQGDINQVQSTLNQNQAGTNASILYQDTVIGSEVHRVIGSEGHAREDSTLTIPRSQLEAEIAESQSKAGSVREWELERAPLVARGVLHPRELTPEEIAILETPIGGDDAFDLTAPMPELPSMKGRSRQTYVEKAKELYAHQSPEVQAKRIAEVEAYQAKLDAKEAEVAAARDPEDAAFEEAMATWLDLYPSLDDRVLKVSKRSLSEIPQGLEAHHDACRKAVVAIADRYSKAVGSPVVGQARAAILRAVLMLAEDGRLSVPGAVDRLMNMLDWWQATDGNPKRRGEDGKDWFADPTAVFGGKESLKSAAGSPRDAGVIIMAGLNAAAAWKHARDRKLDVSKDPFAATGGETYYGIMDAIRDGKWGTQ